MQVTITDSIGHGAIFQKEYPTDFISERGMEETKGIFRFSTGRINFLETWFEGIRILLADIISDNRGIFSYTMDEPVYIMLFCQQGNLSFKLSGLSKEITLEAQQSAFIHIPAGTVKIKSFHKTRITCIQLTKKCYERLLPIGNHDSRTNEISLISPSIELILDSMSECRYSIEMKRIFLEAKVLELLLFQVKQRKVTFSSRYLRKHDFEKIQYAQSLIEENIRTPCSLIELAHKAGLNDFKLKKGFKELLGTTVFSYLNDLRMKKAWVMLTKEKRSVNDVSYEIGYKNPHHFTTAFKKKFGMLPSHLNK
ncbi:AraC family transcriptional regulator [Pedobacter sp. P351]|uniref:AraC family transcriptional regulator n=1 Tax=Pedobacter superstes TaxID=3133441 RepID=UPI0030B27CD7